MLGLFAACSDDEPSDERRTYELRLSMGATSFAEAGLTRALPDGFEAYNQTLQPINQIQAYFTYQDTEGQQHSESCVFTHATSGEGDAIVHSWTSRIALEPLPSYLYGFMPREDANSSTIEAPTDGTFVNGAVLTLEGLNTVTPGDVCVIIGVKGYGAPLPDMSSRQGQFDYNPDTEGNNLYLLVDHIYAGLQVQMKVDPAYDGLRTIELQSMTLTPASAAAVTVNAIVTLKKGETTPTIVYEETPASTQHPATLQGVSGKRLTTSYQAFQACLFPPTAIKYSKYDLETVYNVYDRKGNLIRQGEHAHNTIQLADDLKRGQVRTVKINVNPTYLYMLSDPDLDNPTFSIVP